MQFASTYARDDDASVEMGRYHDGSIALRVMGSDGIPLCTATVCLSAYSEKPHTGNVFIKDYAENDGVLKALQDAGIVGSEVRRVRCGYEEAIEVPLLGAGCQNEYTLV